MSSGGPPEPLKKNWVPKLAGFVGGLVGVGLIGLLDWQTGTQVSLSIVYLLPIGLAVWYTGRLAGVVVSGVAAAVWFALDMLNGVLYSHPFIHFWNVLVRLGFFLLTTLLLGRLRLLTSNLEVLVKKRTTALVAEVVHCQQAEQAARDSEARFRQLAENIKEVFWITDPAMSQMIYVSPGYEEVWGRTCASLYASPRNWMEAVHPDDRKRVSEAAPTKLASGEYDEVFRILQPGGSLRWIHDRAFPIRDDSGKVYRIAGIAEDITNRKAAEAYIAKLAHAVESTAELICITDSQDRFTFVNRAFEHAYGYTAGELLGKTPEILFSPNNPPQLLQAILEQTRSGGWRGEVLDRRKDGTEFPIFLSTSVIKDRSGAILGLMGVGQDITERKRADEKVRLLADAVQSAQELISITDQDNHFTFVNQAFLDAYGYTESEVLGRTPDFLYASANPAGLCEQVFAQTVSGGWRGEIVNRRRDGTEFPIFLNTSPIKTTAEKTIGLIGVARDISERKRAEKQSAAFELLGRRLSGASSPGQAADLILDIASQLFGWDAGYLHLYSRTDDRIVPLLTVDTVEGRRQPVASDTFTLDPSPLMRAVMKDGARLISREADSPPQVPLVAFGQSDRRSASMMYVPIRVQGTSLGILSIQSYTPHAYSAHDLGLLQILADHCGEALLRIEVTEALLAAEGKYHRIFEEATEGIFQITPAGRYRNANPALARMLGYQTPEELMSSVTDIWRQTYVVPEKAMELKQSLEAQSAVQGFEAERYRKDGSKIWIGLNAHAVRDSRGAVLYYEGTNQDITARKKAEAVLRASEARLRLLTEQVPATLWTTDRDLKFTSATGSRLAAWKTSDILGRSLSEFFGTTDDSAPAIIAHRAALQGERSVVEMGWGGRFWRANVEPLVDADGMVIGCIGVALDITSAKRVEEQLRASERQFRQVTEAIREVFWMTNVEKTEMLYVSPGYETIWGLSCASLKANPRQWVEAIHLDDRDRVLQAVVTKQLVGEYDEEYRIVRPDGDERWIRDRAFPVRDDLSGIIRIAGIAEDITRHKKTEEALRAAEAKYRGIFENATEGIFQTTLDGRYLNANPALARMFGYESPEELISRVSNIERQTFVSPENAAELKRLLSTYDSVLGFEAERYRQDGSTYWTSINVRVVRDANGAFLYYEGTVQDVTERKRAVESLRASERKLRLIAENTTDVIFAFDMERRPAYVNPAVTELTGYTFAEIQEKKFINWIHPADQERMLKLWEELYTGKGYSDVEFRLITKTGQTKWCSSTWGPLFNEKGLQIGVQGREQDITRRKLLELEVLQSSANERRRIGHELHDGLGQYLAGIALKTKALEENLVSERSAQASIAQRVVGLLNNAIGQTRTLAHGLDPVHVEADGLVAALENLTGQTEELYGIECVFVCNEKKLAVNAQAGLALYRITQEAMHNGAQHGRARRIEVELQVDAIHLRLRIRDNGRGFSPESKPDAGMGLRVMRYRANAIGGTLKIRSSVGEGTELTCDVPRKNCG